MVQKNRHHLLTQHSVNQMLTFFIAEIDQARTAKNNHKLKIIGFTATSSKQ